MEGTNAKPRRRRLLVWSVVGAVLVIGTVAGLLVARNANGNGKKKNGKEPPPAAPVEVAVVGRGSITTFLESTTTLEAQNTATLVARSQGQVLDLPAEEGEWIEKGATLARLDDTAAQLAVERADVEAQLAKREIERGRQLREKGFLSDKELDDLELKQRTTNVALDEARYALSQTRIVAPFSGRVTGRTVNLGETVTPGRECFRLEDFDPLLARLYFPERELARVTTGQTATLTFDGFPGREFEARVSLVNPVVERANGTFKVTLEVRDPQRVLRPGNFARVRLKTGSHDNSLLVPRRAMVSEDGEDFVFVAHRDTVERVRVKIGAVSEGSAQVLTGLSAGDSVVTVGQGGLKPGSHIKPVKL